MKQPALGFEAAIIATAAIVPEAWQHGSMAAWEALQEDVPGIGLMVVTSSELLNCGWSDARAAGRRGGSRECVQRRITRRTLPTASLVTVIDGSPSALSWIAGVRGSRVSPLGVDRAGQTGDLPDL